MSLAKEGQRCLSSDFPSPFPAALKGWLLQIWPESKATDHRDALIAALPEHISYLEMLKTLVDSRFAQPSWYAGIAGNNEAANLRELATMQALALNLLDKLKKSLEAEVNLHGGKILELRGDGALCRFDSTLEGVRAAMNLQAAMQINPIVPVRIGMHTGDVIVSGNSVFGDGVNIASRVESFAIPGSIFISSRVHDDIKNQKDIHVQSLGAYSLKNVKEQMRIVR